MWYWNVFFVVIRIMNCDSIQERSAYLHIDMCMCVCVLEHCTYLKAQSIAQAEKTKDSDLLLNEVVEFFVANEVMCNNASTS